MGTNWTTDEEVQLCLSWRAITVCNITGNQQTLPHMWNKIHEHYVDNWEGETAVRPPPALCAHFKHLKKLLKEWHNAIMQAENYVRLRPSGTNYLDEVHFFSITFNHFHYFVSSYSISAQNFSTTYLLI